MKIISQIMGGLGNQMFQYACARAVAHRIDAQLYLDLFWFENGNRTFMLDIFPNINYSISHPPKSIVSRVLRKIDLNKINYIDEPVHYQYSYWSEIENIRNSAHLSGYWQNEKYFSNITSIIRQDFTFPELPSYETEKIANKIKVSSCPVSIHIRRGDYVKNPVTNRFHGICSQEYYEKALQIIVGKHKDSPELYIFSDEPEWVKDNFDTLGYPSHVVDIPQHKDSPYHDMHLMSLCRHHIIANSSFSWWAAWLSGRDGTVVAPKQWFAEETMKHYNPSLASWITI